MSGLSSPEISATLKSPITHNNTVQKHSNTKQKNKSADLQDKNLQDKRKPKDQKKQKIEHDVPPSTSSFPTSSVIDISSHNETTDQSPSSHYSLQTLLQKYVGQSTAFDDTLIGMEKKEGAHTVPHQPRKESLRTLLSE